MSKVKGFYKKEDKRGRMVTHPITSPNKSYQIPPMKVFHTRTKSACQLGKFAWEDEWGVRYYPTKEQKEFLERVREEIGLPSDYPPVYLNVAKVYGSVGHRAGAYGKLWRDESGEPKSIDLPTYISHTHPKWKRVAIEELLHVKMGPQHTKEFGLKLRSVFKKLVGLPWRNETFATRGE